MAPGSKRARNAGSVEKDLQANWLRYQNYEPVPWKCVLSCYVPFGENTMDQGCLVLCTSRKSPQQWDGLIPLSKPSPIAIVIGPGNTQQSLGSLMFLDSSVPFSNHLGCLLNIQIPGNHPQRVYLPRYATELGDLPFFSFNKFWGDVAGCPQLSLPLFNK